MVNGEGGERKGCLIGRVVNVRVVKGGVAIGRVVKVATPNNLRETLQFWDRVETIPYSLTLSQKLFVLAAIQTFECRSPGALLD